MSSARTGTGRDDWNTPPEVLELVRQLGRIDLDPCSNGNSLVEAASVLDGAGQGDGLRAAWGEYVSAGGLVFVNPPYSKAATWAAKMVEQAECGVPIVALVAARTDTRYWQAMHRAADAIGLWRRRMRFWLDGEPATVWSKKLKRHIPASATFPSALLGFNVSQRRFRAVFAGVAEVVIP